MMYIQYRTSQTLKKMSYIRTRYRQLPFRYFLLQGLLVTLQVFCVCCTRACFGEHCENMREPTGQIMKGSGRETRRILSLSSGYPAHQCSQAGVC